MIRILFSVLFFIQFGLAQEDGGVTNEDRLRSISDHLSPSSISPLTLLALGLGIFGLILFVVFYEIIKSDRTKKVQHESQWISFERGSQERGITHDLVELLRKVMQNSDRHTPDMALQSPRVYELALEAYIRNNKELNNNPNHPEFESLHNLRLALGYDIIHPEMPYVSTRQLRPGDQLSLKMKLKSTGEESNHPHPADVKSVDESRWEISFGGSIPDGLPTIKLSYTRAGDADYLLEVPIIEQRPGILLLGHTTQLLRKQQRNWVRWATDIHILVKGKIKQGDKDVETEVAALSSDISGGGLSFSCEGNFEGKFVTLQFTLPPARSFRNVNAEVVRKVPLFQGSPQIKYSVFFSDMEDTEREHIVRYIFEQQRQMAKERPI